jgi:hypothetical protein
MGSRNGESQRGVGRSTAQRFLAASEPIRDHFCPRRHGLPAARHRAELAACFHTWKQVAGPAASACVPTAQGAIVAAPDRIGGPPHHTMRHDD